MLGREVFTIPRPVKAQTRFAVSWAYPNLYSIGMAGLGYQLVWWLLEQDRQIEVYRAFTDCQEDGWETSELLGFTLSWELDYANVLKLLRKRGISPLSSERKPDQPLVFAGGPVLSANPEPFADIFDVILLGDAEAVVPRFIEAWTEARRLPERQDQLLQLARVEGLYVPSLYRYELSSPRGPIEAVKPVSDQVPARMTRPVFVPPADYVAHSLMLAPDTTWGDMFLVEIARSCPQECRFCLASYLTRPFRAARVETLIEKFDLGLKHTRKLGLLGPSVTEHPEFDRIAQALLERPATRVSIASVRADTLSPLILDMLSRLGQRSVTIALESGSERLRAIMKKNLSNEQVERAVGLIEQSGLEALKLYGIVGLPGETDEDLDETVRLITALKRSHRRLRFTFGVSSFVPKAQTPFQWAGRDRNSGKKLESLRKRLARLGVEVRPESHNWSDIQALISRGDRRLTPVLISVAEGAGNLGAWRRALRNLPDSCPGHDYYVYRDIPYQETLPWSHLVEETKLGMLIRHSRLADHLAEGSLAPGQPFFSHT